MAKTTSFLVMVLLLSGCGEQGTDSGDTPLLTTDGGVSYCEIPSPTGDQPAQGPSGPLSYTAREGVQKNTYFPYLRPRLVEDDSRRLCLAWTAVVPAGKDPAGSPYPAYCPRGVSQAECDHRMTESECAGVADDMLDSVGYRHCWVVMTDATGKASLSSMGIMVSSARNSSGTLEFAREVLVCSTGGKFLGWLCAGMY